MKIAIVGKMRSGKDTIADMLTVKQGFKTLAFADGIREIVTTYFPEALEKGKPREHYQFIGQELRKLNPNVWINTLDRRAADFTDIIVTDCRQVNEAIYLRENGYMIIKVYASDNLRVKRICDAGEVVSLEQFEHDTEKQVDEIVADFAIVNNGTYAELQEAVDTAYHYCLVGFPIDLEHRKQQGVTTNESS